METLLYVAFWVGLIWLMIRFGCGAHVMAQMRGEHEARDKSDLERQDALRWEAPETDVDPVCGEEVHTDQAKPSVYDGMVYYFCSRECRERFEAAPHLYVEPAPGEALKQLGRAHG